ncbi:MAG: hypothetical protein ABSB82_17060 [Terriglobia bacterium]|jgi:hypothetical protein
MEETIAQERGPELVPPSSPSADSAGPPEVEQKPADEIGELWSIHLEAKSVAREAKQALKDVRQRLSERLSEIKPLLARPGRSGQWSAWLKERGISRATADRLVRRHAAALPGNESTHEAISNPPVDSAEKLAKAQWPRFRKILNTDESVIQFLGSIAEISGVAHEWQEEGLMIFRAVPKAADQLSDSDSATDPVPQASDNGSGITEEPIEETAAALPASGLAAAAGDASGVQALQPGSGEE